MESSTIMEEDQVHQETVPPLPGSNFPMAMAPVGERPIENLTLGRPRARPIRPTPILPIPPSSKMANLNLKEKGPIDPFPLSLKLPTPPSPSTEQSSSGSPHSSDSHSPSTFQATSGKFSNSSGDKIISVA